MDHDNTDITIKITRTMAEECVAGLSNGITSTPERPIPARSDSEGTPTSGDTKLFKHPVVCLEKMDKKTIQEHVSPRRENYSPSILKRKINTGPRGLSALISQIKSRVGSEEADDNEGESDAKNGNVSEGEDADRDLSSGESFYLDDSGDEKDEEGEEEKDSTGEETVDSSSSEESDDSTSEFSVSEKPIAIKEEPEDAGYEVTPSLVNIETVNDDVKVEPEDSCDEDMTSSLKGILEARKVLEKSLQKSLQIAKDCVSRVSSENPQSSSAFKTFESSNRGNTSTSGQTSAFTSNELETYLSQNRDLRRPFSEVETPEVDEVEGVVFMSFSSLETMHGFSNGNKSQEQADHAPGSPTKGYNIENLKSIKQKKFQYGIAGNVSKYLKKQEEIKNKNTLVLPAKPAPSSRPTIVIGGKKQKTVSASHLFMNITRQQQKMFGLKLVPFDGDGKEHSDKESQPWRKATKRGLASIENGPLDNTSQRIYGRRNDGKFASKSLVRNTLEFVKNEKEKRKHKPSKAKLVKSRKLEGDGLGWPRKMSFQTVVISKTMARTAVSALNLGDEKSILGIPSTTSGSLTQHSQNLCDKEECRLGCTCRISSDAQADQESEHYMYDEEDKELPPLPPASTSCTKLYCRLGCVCETLTSCAQPKEHCGKLDCMFSCSCGTPGQPMELKHVSLLSTLPAGKENSPSATPPRNGVVDAATFPVNTLGQGDENKETIRKSSRLCQKGRVDFSKLDKMDSLIYYDAQRWIDYPPQRKCRDKPSPAPGLYPQRSKVRRPATQYRPIYGSQERKDSGKQGRHYEPDWSPPMQKQSKVRPQAKTVGELDEEEVRRIERELERNFDMASDDDDESTMRCARTCVYKPVNRPSQKRSSDRNQGNLAQQSGPAKAKTASASVLRKINQPQNKSDAKPKPTEQKSNPNTQNQTSEAYKPKTQMVLLQRSSNSGVASKDSESHLLQIQATCDWESDRTEILAKLSSVVDSGHHKDDSHTEFPVKKYMVEILPKDNKQVPVTFPPGLHGAMKVKKLIPLKVRIKLLQRKQKVPPPKPERKVISPPPQPSVSGISGLANLKVSTPKAWNTSSQFENRINPSEPPPMKRFKIGPSEDSSRLNIKEVTGASPTGGQGSERNNNDVPVITNVRSMAGNLGPPHVTKTSPNKSPSKVTFQVPTNLTPGARIKVPLSMLKATGPTTTLTTAGAGNLRPIVPAGQMIAQPGTAVFVRPLSNPSQNMVLLNKQGKTVLAPMSAGNQPAINVPGQNIRLMVPVNPGPVGQPIAAPHIKIAPNVTTTTSMNKVIQSALPVKAGLPQVQLIQGNRGSKTIEMDVPTVVENTQGSLQYLTTKIATEVQKYPTLPVAFVSNVNTVGSWLEKLFPPVETNKVMKEVFIKQWLFLSNEARIELASNPTKARDVLQAMANKELSKETGLQTKSFKQVQLPSGKSTFVSTASASVQIINNTKPATVSRINSTFKAFPSNVGKDFDIQIDLSNGAQGNDEVTGSPVIASKVTATMASPPQTTLVGQIISPGTKPSTSPVKHSPVLGEVLRNAPDPDFRVLDLSNAGQQINISSKPSSEDSMEIIDVDGDDEEQEIELDIENNDEKNKTNAADELKALLKSHSSSSTNGKSLTALKKTVKSKRKQAHSQRSDDPVFEETSKPSNYDVRSVGLINEEEMLEREEINSDIHNLRERCRRHKMASMFQKLKQTLFPGKYHDLGKASKQFILTNAVETILNLRDTSADLKQELDYESQKRDKLIAKLKALKGLKKNKVAAVTRNEETGVTTQIDEEPILSEAITPAQQLYKPDKEPRKAKSERTSDSQHRSVSSAHSKLPQPEVYVDIAEPNYLPPSSMSADEDNDNEQVDIIDITDSSSQGTSNADNSAEMKEEPMEIDLGSVDETPIFDDCAEYYPDVDDIKEEPEPENDETHTVKMEQSSEEADETPASVTGSRSISAASRSSIGSSLPCSLGELPWEEEGEVVDLESDI